MASLNEPASLHAAYDKRALFTSNASVYGDPTRFWKHDALHRVYIIIDLKEESPVENWRVITFDIHTTNNTLCTKGEISICLL